MSSLPGVETVVEDIRWAMQEDDVAEAITPSADIRGSGVSVHKYWGTAVDVAIDDDGHVIVTQNTVDIPNDQFHEQVLKLIEFLNEKYGLAYLRTDKMTGRRHTVDHVFVEVAH